MILPDDRFSDSMHRLCTCSIRTDFLYMWGGRGMMACGREMVLFRNFRCLNDFRVGREAKWKRWNSTINSLGPSMPGRLELGIWR